MPTWILIAWQQKIAFVWMAIRALAADLLAYLHVVADCDIKKAVRTKGDLVSPMLAGYPIESDQPLG
jgi:hypothetical protein